MQSGDWCGNMVSFNPVHRWCVDSVEYWLGILVRTLWIKFIINIAVNLLVIYIFWIWLMHKIWNISKCYLRICLEGPGKPYKPQPISRLWWMLIIQSFSMNIYFLTVPHDFLPPPPTPILELPTPSCSFWIILIWSIIWQRGGRCTTDTNLSVPLAYFKVKIKD